MNFLVYKKNIILLSASLGIVLLVIYLGMRFWKNSDLTMENKNLQYILARQLYSNGKYGDAIAILKKLSLTSDGAAQMNTLLGTSLIKTGEFSNMKEGVLILSDIINNVNLSAALRSAAATSLASQLIIFTPEQYATIVPLIKNINSNEDFSSQDEAYRIILEKSISLYPNSYAMYSLAGGHYYIRQVTSSIPLEEKLEIATKMQALIYQGDQLGVQNNFDSPEVKASGAYYKARALTASMRVLNNLESDVIKNAYQTAINYGEDKNYNDYLSVKYYAYLSRFYYSNFLLEFEKGDNIDLVEEIIRPVAELKGQTNNLADMVRAYFVEVSANPQVNFNPRVNALRVAKVSSEFKDFLASIAFKGL